jgi:uncharacterized protein (DUF849 family)
MQKAILSCAITGAIHTPSMSPHLPATAQAIANDAIAAAQAGASILHLHARDNATGRPIQTADAFREFLPKIAAHTDAILNITTGGSPHMTVAERVAPARDLSPELASLNMGSMNFGLFPMLKRYDAFDHDWERAHLENSRDLVFKNTYADIDHILGACLPNGTRFEFECYDTSHLYNLAHFADRGVIKPPFLVQTVFGILGGIGTHPDDVAHMKRTADRLFGRDYIWSVLGAGRSQMQIAATAVAQGGSLRVGLEDNLWIAKGELATSNAQQVQKARDLLASLSVEVATPDEARAMLHLKGRDKVGF